MSFRIYRTSDGAGIIRYEKISTSPIGGGGKSLRTATRIVAASNSLDKTRADYVCDGVHDEEEINKAISDLADVGGTVLLLEGTYNIGSAGTREIQAEGGAVEIAYGIYITSNVSLVGQGRSTILVTDSNNFDIGNAFGCAVILSDNASGIEVSHITINGNQQNLTTPIFGILLANFTARTSDSAVTDCYIYSITAAIGGYTDRCIVARNICNNGVYNGIAIVGDSNTVYSNICSDLYFGIAVAGTNNSIYSNICYSIFGYGITIGMSSYITSSNNLVYGNICYGCDGASILVYGSDYNSVIGNVCHMNNGYGIEIIGSNNIISDNQVLGNSQGSDNYRDGIYLMSWRGVQSSYNTISNNVVRHMGLDKQQRYGIYIGSGCVGNLVINNDLYQAGKTADFYDEGTDTVYHNNRTTEEWVS